MSNVLLPLTNAMTKQTFGLCTQVILVAERDPEKGITTRVVTSMNFGQGPVVYEVFETPEEIVALALAVNKGDLEREKLATSKPASLVAS